MSEEKKEDKPSTVARYNPQFERWEIRRPELKDGKPYKDKDNVWVRGDWDKYKERDCPEFTMANFINYWLEIVKRGNEKDGEEPTLSMLSKRFNRTVPTILRKKSHINKKYKELNKIKDEKFSIFPPIKKRHTDDEEEWIEAQKNRKQREDISQVLKGIDADLFKLLNASRPDNQQ